jgi:hypothetical protein
VIYRLLAAACIVVSMALTAAAQQTRGAEPAANVLLEVSDRESMLVPRLNITVGELRDLTLYGAEGEAIGEIDDVLAESGGRIVAVTIDVGGVLGINERQVVINLDQIQLDGLRMTLPLAKEEIEQLPEWE